MVFEHLRPRLQRLHADLKSPRCPSRSCRTVFKSLALLPVTQAFPKHRTDILVSTTFFLTFSRLIKSFHCNEPNWNSYLSSQPTPTPTPTITGIHHVTAFAKDPVANVNFYTRVLGLRLVKQTVNFDDPSTYHLYYGDHSGSPGTLLTHFPNPRAARTNHASCEITDTLLLIPENSLDAWATRLNSLRVSNRIEYLLGSTILRFEDHDGMRFGFVEAGPNLPQTTDLPRASINPKHAIRGVAGVEIHVPNAAATIDFLTTSLGFKLVQSERDAHWLALDQVGLNQLASDQLAQTQLTQTQLTQTQITHSLASSTISNSLSAFDRSHLGQRLVIIQDPSPHTTMGAGTVHHVAWRVPNLATQKRASEAINAAGIAVTPVIDRNYFHSIYFKIPGGVIFEIATDTPGFAVDEPLDTLGTTLQLPSQYESRRTTIERALVPLPTQHGS